MEMAHPCSQILDNSLGLWEKARERDCDLWEKERMFGGWDKANPSRLAQLLHRVNPTRFHSPPLTGPYRTFASIADHFLSKNSQADLQ